MSFPRIEGFENDELRNLEVIWTIVGRTAKKGKREKLEPFSIAQEKTKESMVPEKGKEREKIDWRQRRKRSDGDVGVYQLEELVL